MLKYLLVFTLSFVLMSSTKAQSAKDTLRYFINKNGDAVNAKEEFDYLLLILPAQPGDKKNLRPVIGLYADGKRKMIATAIVKAGTYLFEGTQISFFHNGKRSSLTIYDRGKKIGEQLAYYPNGLLYTKKAYKDKTVLFLECRDSTGVVLAENGNGEWLDFDLEFKNLIAKGNVKNGLADGNWEYTTGTESFKKGNAIDYKMALKSYPEVGARDLLSEEFYYLPKNGLPTYQGGWKEIQTFVSKNLRHVALDNNSSGQAYVAFFVEKNGAPSKFKVLYSPSKATEEEALRVVESLPPLWTPVQSNGEAVRSSFIIPVYFSSNNLDPDSVFTFKDSSAEFFASYPGGADAFSIFLEDQLRYPRLEKVNNISGTVYLTFTTEQNGSLNNIHVLSAPTVGLAEEALKLLKLYAKQLPGLVSNISKKQYVLPIDFKIPKHENLSISLQDSIYMDRSRAFVNVDEMPEFPGGLEKFGQFLVKHIRYPENDRSQKVMGKVFLSFMVEKDGTITDLKILRSPSKSLGDEAIRVMKLSPLWKPGKIGTDPVPVRFVLPINFSLDTYTPNIPVSSNDLYR